MYNTHYLRVATEFKWRINDGSKVQVDNLVDTTELGTFIPNGLIWASALRDSKWFGPTDHFRWGEYPHRVQKAIVSCCSLNTVNVLP